MLRPRGVRGSFLIFAFTKVNGQRKHIGTEAILSRWHVTGCMNCMSHLEATATFHVPPGAGNRPLPPEVIEVEVRTHGGLLGGRPQAARHAARGAATLAAEPGAPLRAEIF